MVRLVILRLLESYFRHRWAYIVPVIVMIVAGAASIVFAKPNYMTGGSLYIQKETLLQAQNSITTGEFDFWETPADATAAEINELMRSNAFMRAVVQQTDLEANMVEGPDEVYDTLEEARFSVWTQSLGQNQMAIWSAHEDPDVSFQLVSAVIDTFIQWQINADLSDSLTAQTFFQDLIDDYGAELASARSALDDYLIAHPPPLRGDRPQVEQLQIDRLQADIALSEARYASALDKEENTRLAAVQSESTVRQTYIILDAPEYPERPTSGLRSLAKNAALFVMVGVVISVIGVAGGALLDRSFLFPLDVEQVLGLPVIGVAPEVNSVWPPGLKPAPEPVPETAESAEHASVAGAPQGA